MRWLGVLAVIAAGVQARRDRRASRARRDGRTQGPFGAAELGELFAEELGAPAEW
jgi:hypothetical protein